MKCGFVTIIGRPNVGKSTLLNQILGQKIVITTDKAQTTRKRIKGILTESEGQVIFVDTPGIHRPLNKLGEFLMDEAKLAVPDADLILFLVDGSEPAGKGDKWIVENLLKDNKIILGIDPGTNILGFGVIGINNKGPYYVNMGVFDLRKIKDPYEKLANIFAGVSELIEEHKPDCFAVESPFYGKNAQVVLKLGRAQGAALTAAVMKGLTVAEYAPRKAKIAICGNGAASKEQVAMMIQKTLNVQLDPKHLDATDALAIALCHHYQMTNPLAGAGSSTDWKRFLADNPDRIKKINNIFKPLPTETL